jgi:membrane protein DedA with SNARE-associated domain
MIEASTDPFTLWLIRYGCLALFFILALGIVALPVPEDTLMLFTGILIQRGALPPILAIFSACAGSMCGITVSYLLGRFAGDVIIKKYGGYIGLTEIRMAKMHGWFERFGRWILFIGYFIAGIRHFTGIFAGITSMEYKHFSLYAYAGAICWVCSLIGIGFFFGECCNQVIEYAEDNISLVAAAVIGLWALYLLFKSIFFKTKRDNTL